MNPWTEYDQAAADFEDRRAYETWAQRRREDGEDASEEAYVEYLEGFFPPD